MKIIDVHCHIDQYDNWQLKRIMEGCHTDRVVGAAMNWESGEKLLKFQQVYPYLFICLGIHPEYPEYFQEFQAVKNQILNHFDEILAIGEIGLPYYRLEQMSEQERRDCIEKGRLLLTEFLDLAKQLDKPVILHAIEDTAAIALEELKKRQIRSALFHWFEGDLEVMEEIVAHGYYISVSPNVMFNEKYARFVSHVPTEAIVLESDGPWEYNGQKGVPSMVTDTLAFLSKARDIKEKELAEKIYKNTCRLFGRII